MDESTLEQGGTKADSGPISAEEFMKISVASTACMYVHYVHFHKSMGSPESSG